MTSLRQRLTAHRGPGGLPEGLPVALLGALLVAFACALVGLQVRAYLLDETLFKLSAVHYSEHLPDSFIHDVTARATSRLYALSLMPLFKAFDGDVAIRLAKVLSAIEFASACIPAFFLARRVLAVRAAIAAAVLTVAVPWVGLTTALFTENVAYPAFLWVVLAMVRAFEAPSWRRDLWVVIAFAFAAGARVQLAFAFPAHVLLVVGLLVAAWRGAAPAVRRAETVRLARAFPFTLAAVGVAILIVVYFAAANELHDKVLALFGDYGSFQSRNTLPYDSTLALFVEVVLIGVGVGLVPMFVGAAWYVTALRSRVVDRAAWAFALVSLAALASLLVLTIAAQNGAIGPLTEERYYIYAVPLLWIATLAAATGRPAVPSGRVWAAAAVLLVLCGSVALPRSLDLQTIVVAPAGAVADRWMTIFLDHLHRWLGILGISERDVLFVVVLALAALVAWAWRRGPGARLAAVGVGAAVQLAMTLYVLLAASGHVASGIADRTAGPAFASLGWIDRAVGRHDVTWLETDPRVDPAQYQALQQQSILWNDRIRTRLFIDGVEMPPDVSPLDAVDPHVAVYRPADGVLSAPGTPEVAVPDSPLAQVAGRVIARQPGGGPLALVQPGSPVRLAWVTRGLRGDGVVVARRPARFAAYAPPGAGGVTVALQLAPVAGGGTATFTAAGRARRITLAQDAAPRTLRLGACGPALRGTVDPTAPGSGGAALRIVSVRVSPRACSG